MFFNLAEAAKKESNQNPNIQDQNQEKDLKEHLDDKQVIEEQQAEKQQAEEQDIWLDNLEKQVKLLRDLESKKKDLNIKINQLSNEIKELTEKLAFLQAEEEACLYQLTEIEDDFNKAKAVLKEML